MTEEDLSALVTSIDENDIEIIPTNEQLDFMPDYFAINNDKDLNPTPPPPPPPLVVSIPATARTLIRADSEEFEDETILERVYSLTEMFPNWLHTFFQNSYQYSKSFGQFMKKSIWFCSSSFLVLVLPILVQLEFSQVTEMQAAQTRQILLGPTAQVASNIGLN